MSASAPRQRQVAKVDVPGGHSGRDGPIVDAIDRTDLATLATLGQSVLRTSNQLSVANTLLDPR
jgi:hypothetical protein